MEIFTTNIDHFDLKEVSKRVACDDANDTQKAYFLNGKKKNEIIEEVISSLGKISRRNKDRFDLIMDEIVTNSLKYSSNDDSYIKVNYEDKKFFIQYCQDNFKELGTTFFTNFFNDPRYTEARSEKSGNLGLSLLRKSSNEIYSIIKDNKLYIGIYIYDGDLRNYLFAYDGGQGV